MRNAAGTIPTMRLAIPENPVRLSTTKVKFSMISGSSENKTSAPIANPITDLRFNETIHVRYLCIHLTVLVIVFIYL